MCAVAAGFELPVDISTPPLGQHSPKPPGCGALRAYVDSASVEGGFGVAALKSTPGFGLEAVQRTFRLSRLCSRCHKRWITLVPHDVGAPEPYRPGSSG